MDTIIILKKNLGQQGGLENQTFQITQAFQKKGFPVTILTSGKIAPHFQDPSLHFHAFKLKSPMNFMQVYEFDAHCQRYLKEHPAKIVFGMERNRFQTHLRLGNGIHRAFLQHLAQFETPFKRASHFFNPGHHTFLQFEKKALEHPELQVVIANSAMVRREILEFYNVDPAKIHVLHNGVDWQGMENDFLQWEPEQDASPFQFLFVGNHYLRKGLKPLLHALSRLKTKEFHLSIVGHERNLKDYQKLAKTLELEKNVTFFGKQANIRPFYQKADCLVIPSIYDPFSNTTVEALAMGLFVVSSKTNGGHEVLNPLNGTTIESLLSIDAIVDALEHALKHRKTKESAKRIRQSVKHLDFSCQLEQLTTLCLS